MAYRGNRVQTDTEWDATEEDVVYHLATYGQDRRGLIEDVGYFEGWIAVLKNLFGYEKYHTVLAIPMVRTKIRTARGTTVPNWDDAWSSTEYGQEVIDHIARNMNMNDATLYTHTVLTLGDDTQLEEAHVPWLKFCIQRSPIAWSQKTRFFCDLLYAQGGLVKDGNDLPLRLDFNEISEIMLRVIPSGEKGREFINEAAVRHCVMTLITSLPVGNFNDSSSLKWFKKESGGSPPPFERVENDSREFYYLSEEEEAEVFSWMTELGLPVEDPSPLS